MFRKKKQIRMSHEDEQRLFALDEFIQRLIDPNKPMITQHPVRTGAYYYGDYTNEELDIIDAQNRIKRLLGIES